MILSNIKLSILAMSNFVLGGAVIPQLVLILRKHFERLRGNGSHGATAELYSQVFPDPVSTMNSIRRICLPIGLIAIPWNLECGLC